MESKDNPQLEAIASFAHQGWACYTIGTLKQIYSLEQLTLLIEMGREKETLVDGHTYILLPLLEKDDNADLVFALAEKVRLSHREPYWITQDDDHKMIMTLIDSIVFHDETQSLHLRPDIRLSNNSDIRNIVLSADQIPAIRQHMMVCMRGKNDRDKMSYKKERQG